MNRLDQVTNIDWCAGESREKFACSQRTAFVVGVPMTGSDQWRGSCAQHIAQIVRLQIDRLKPDTGGVVVAPVRELKVAP